MAAAIPERDFITFPASVLVTPTNPTDPAIGEGCRVGANVFGIAYATHPTTATVAYILLPGGYGQVVPAVADSGNAITQGEKIYMVDSTASTRPTFTNDSSGNNFAGYALPAEDDDADTAQLVAAGATGNILLYVRPE